MSAEAMSATADPRAGTHILVAEDEPDIRANLGRLLRLEGFEVSLAANGQQALQRIHDGLPSLPDLVLTDLMMPGMDGMALLRALRADPRTAHLPVVLLSARTEAEQLQGGLAIGANAYITKPYERAPLLACIRALLAPGVPGGSDR